MRRFIIFNSATKSSAGLTFSIKNSKRIRQCQRTCQDNGSAVLNGLLVLLLLLPHIKVTKNNDAADAVERLLGMATTGLLSTNTLKEDGVEGGVDEDDEDYGL